MSKTTKKTRKFKAEVQQVLNLIVNSLYSNKEIFLRELVSNASDAIDKIRFKSLTNLELLGNDSKFYIKIIPDPEKNTLTVKDNGIGMTYDEILENIGTIARSGTASFLEALKKSQNTLTPELIGQFGVGFYSAFMVADKITLITKHAESDTAYKWSADSNSSSYTIEETEKDSRGTEITLSLKSKEEREEDFANEWVIKHIIQKHSDFITYPILMDVERNEVVEDDVEVLDKDGKKVHQAPQKVIKEETLNSMQAIWARDKAEISEDEYNEFYKHVSHDYTKPLARFHGKFEGTTEYCALLYIPERAPSDLFSPHQKHGVHLYCKKVFIMDDCKELMPNYLRFIKGVVDAPDLNLNISREILQQDALVKKIKGNLVKKVLDLLVNMEEEKYEQFHREFGRVLKEGIHSDKDNKDKIADLLRYQTTKSEGKYISFKKYIENMKEDQKEIYYITGEDISLIRNRPHIEALKDKDYEVLLMTDPVDEFVVQSLSEYDGKRLKSAEKGTLDTKEVDESKEKEYSSLFEHIKSKLEEKIRDVRPSTRLKDSISCLSGGEYDMSSYMQSLMKKSGQQPLNTRRILEINMEHPAVTKIKEIYDKDQNDESLDDYYNLLFNVALIGEGEKVDDSVKFSSAVARLMAGKI
jgi:molecular chaperone HtpG